MSWGRSWSRWFQATIFEGGRPCQPIVKPPGELRRSAGHQEVPKVPQGPVGYPRSRTSQPMTRHGHGPSRHGTAVCIFRSFVPGGSRRGGSGKSGTMAPGRPRDGVMISCFALATARRRRPWSWGGMGGGGRAGRALWAAPALDRRRRCQKKGAGTMAGMVPNGAAAPARGGHAGNGRWESDTRVCRD